MSKMKLYVAWASILVLLGVQDGLELDMYWTPNLI